MWETVGPSPLCGGCYRYNAPGCFVTPLPRTRIIEHRDLTGQLADESDFERQGRGFGGHNAHLVHRQRLAWQSIRKDELDNTLHEPQPTRSN